jgi:hypothetical protein
MMPSKLTPLSHPEKGETPTRFLIDHDPSEQDLEEVVNIIRALAGLPPLYPSAVNKDKHKPKPKKE